MPTKSFMDRLLELRTEQDMDFDEFSHNLLVAAASTAKLMLDIRREQDPLAVAMVLELDNHDGTYLSCKYELAAPHNTELEAIH